MGDYVFDSCVVSVNGQDYSGSAMAMNLDIPREEVETTDFADAMSKTTKAGLKTPTFMFTLKNDFTDNLTDELMFGLLDAGTEVTVFAQKTTGAPAADNPKYNWTGWVKNWSPFKNAKPGALAVCDVEIGFASKITRSVA